MAPDLRVVSLMDLAQMLQIQWFEVIQWEPWNDDESWHLKQKIPFKLGWKTYKIISNQYRFHLITNIEGPKWTPCDE